MVDIELRPNISPDDVGGRGGDPDMGGEGYARDEQELSCSALFGAQLRSSAKRARSDMPRRWPSEGGFVVIYWSPSIMGVELVGVSRLDSKASATSANRQLVNLAQQTRRMLEWSKINAGRVQLPAR